MPNLGRLVLYVGPMYSGKSTELLRAGARCEVARKETLYLKPHLDATRYEKERQQNITSHFRPDTFNMQALAVREAVVDYLFEPESLAREPVLYKLFTGVQVFLFDEVQFFEAHDFLCAAQLLLRLGCDVICAGLSGDMFRQPWPTVSRLMSLASEVHFKDSVCMLCKRDHAAFTSRVVPVDMNVTDHQADREAGVGGLKEYEARCEQCWAPPPIALPEEEEEEEAPRGLPYYYPTESIKYVLGGRFDDQSGEWIDLGGEVEYDSDATELEVDESRSEVSLPSSPDADYDEAARIKLHMNSFYGPVGRRAKETDREASLENNPTQDDALCGPDFALHYNLMVLSERGTKGMTTFCDMVGHTLPQEDNNNNNNTD